jgi:hypothetical protein
MECVFSNSSNSAASISAGLDLAVETAIYPPDVISNGP